MGKSGHTAADVERVLRLFSRWFLVGVFIAELCTRDEVCSSRPSEDKHIPENFPFQYCPGVLQMDHCLPRRSSSSGPDDLLQPKMTKTEKRARTCRTKALRDEGAMGEGLNEARCPGLSACLLACPHIVGSWFTLHGMGPGQVPWTLGSPSPPSA